MQRITTPDSLFHDGDPFNNVQGTVVTAAFLNSLQEEIATIIELAGITLSPATSTQLMQALVVLFASKLQVQNNSLTYASGVGTANAPAASFSPAITTLTDGMVLYFQAAATNTGAATFSPNGLAAKPIVGGAHTPLQGGEIVNGGKVELMYHVGIASWVLLGCTGGTLQVGTAAQSQQAVNLGQANALVAAGVAAATTPLNQLYFMGQI